MGLGLDWVTKDGIHYPYPKSSTVDSIQTFRRIGELEQEKSTLQEIEPLLKDSKKAIKEKDKEIEVYRDKLDAIVIRNASVEEIINSSERIDKLEKELKFQAKIIYFSFLLIGILAGCVIIF